MANLAEYPSGNVTIVFTDIEKSATMTRRLERQGLDLYQRKLQGPCRERLLAEVERCRGFEIQCVGDGHMFVFQLAADALASVVAFQRSLHDKPIAHTEEGETWTVRVRIGVHTAEKQRVLDKLPNGLAEYPGNDTNFAARVGGLGRGGQVLLSASTAREAIARGGYDLHPWPNRLLKSFDDQAHVVHEVLYHPGQEPFEPGMQWLPDWYRFERNLYIDRPALEAKVTGQLTPRPDGKQGPRIVTLWAEGGMGKTRLAIACAAKLANLFEHGVAFVPLAAVVPGEAAVAEAIGRAIGLPSGESNPTSVLAALRERSLLLVLDNYESVKELAVARFLNRLIVGAHGLRLLVTGRSAVDHPDLEWIIPDLQAGLTDGEARDLFLARARLRWGSDRDLTAAEEPQWERIRRLTDRIPLAVELAAAWAKNCELREIADGLEATPLGDETGLPEEAIRLDDEIALGRHNSLTRSLDWSHDLLGRTYGEAAQALFATCGLFADSFDEPTVAIVADVSKPRTGLHRLADASLIRREPRHGQSRYRLHRFTREYASRRLAEAPTGEEARRRFVAHYVRLVRENARDPNQIGRYKTLDAEWRNALGVFPVARLPEDYSSLGSMTTLGQFLRFRGLCSEAEYLNRQILAIVRSANDRRNEGVILNSMGVVYRAQGRYGEALDAYAGDLAICREFGDRVGEGSTLNNMGVVYEAQGRYGEALDAYAGSLAIRREFGDRVGEGRTLNNMGVVYRAQGRYGEALDAYAGSLAIRREFGDRVGEGGTLNNMGGLHQIQGRYGEALDAYAGSLAICREFGDRVGEGSTLNNMGVVYRAQGRYGEALDAYAGSLAIRREFGDRVGEGGTLNNMGGLHQIQGRYGEALDAYAGSLAICREFGDRVGEGSTLNNMGVVYRAQGRYGEALDAYAGSLAIQREFGDRVGEGRTLENLALLAEAQGQRSEAIRRAREAVAVLATTQATMALEKAQRTLDRLEAADPGEGEAGEG